MKRATIDDVAAEAGVSKTTVSRVINGEDTVREDTRERVLAVVERLRYQPKLAARTMAGARSMWVALLYQRTNSGSVLLVQSGAMASCARSNHLLLVHECQHDGEALEREILGLAEQLQPCGVILMPPLSLQPRVLEILRNCGMPFVRLCPEHGVDRSPRLWFDDRSAIHEVTSHVIVQGHRELAMISGVPLEKPDPRRQGYVDAVRDHRLGAAVEQRVLWGNFSFEQSLEAARQLLRRKRRPTAIITATDDMAAACMYVARSMGLDVPRDLSVTGFDDAFVAQVLWPPLTTVHAPIRELGGLAANMLIEGTLDMHSGQAVNLPYRMVLRDSVGPPPTVS